MTQDATNPDTNSLATPLQVLSATLREKLNPTPPVDNEHVGPGCEQFCDDDELAAARQALIADGINPDAKITFDENGDAPMGADAFLDKLHQLESEGAALLQSGEHALTAVGHTILGIAEHALHPTAPAPHLLDRAQALPLAMPGDLLHESEHAIIRAFMDVDDKLRHVYLNIHSQWVKA